MFEPGEKVTIASDNPRVNGTVGEVVEYVCYYLVKTPYTPGGTIRCLPSELAGVMELSSPPPAPAKRTEATGELCRKDGCGGMMVRTGTCLTCQSCGDSSGGCS